MLPAAFFIPEEEDVFQPTLAAQGPWDANAMHGGPPAALLATLVQRAATTLSPTLRLGRLSLDFLGPLRIAPLATTVSVLRPGRRVALVEATLSADDQRLAVGRGWLLDAAAPGGESPLESAGPPDAPGELAPLVPPPPREGPQPQEFFEPGLRFGYGEACEWRFTSGKFASPGPAGVWARPRLPLIAGEALTGLQRLLIIADAANGISSELPYRDWAFIPTGLAVTMLREPVGDWVHLAARTTLGTDGIGLCHARLADEHGPTAIASQPLLISRR